MPRLLPALLLCAAAASAMAWEPLASNERAAVQGDELAEAVLEAGLPVPPTFVEAEQAAGLYYGRDRAVIKRCMAYRTSLVKAARNRITREINLSTAEMARHLGAPKLFITYLEKMADEYLSRRQAYVLNQAFNYLLRETYSIDVLAIRVLSESLRLPAQEHTAFMLQLPLAHLFEFVPTVPPAPDAVLADIQTMTSVLRQCDNILRSVHDRSSADAAAAQLAELLPLWSTTLQTRTFARQMSPRLTPAEQFAAQLLETTTARLLATRRRLQEKDWYGSTRLLALDELLR